MYSEGYRYLNCYVNNAICKYDAYMFSTNVEKCQPNFEMQWMAMKSV